MNNTDRGDGKAGRKELLPVQRQSMIKDFLVEKGFVSIAVLGQQFNVSEMTIRRDLDELESQGLIQRTYGGAVSTEPTFFEMSFQAKASQYAEEKSRIGKTAADLVQAGQTIILDSGSTTDQIAKNLKNMRLTVITNALNIVSELNKYTDIEVMVTGGMLRKGMLCLAGPHATDFMKTVRADILFLGVEGVDMRAGFTVPDIYTADNKRSMAKAASKVYVVADHSKLRRVSTSSIISFDQANLLITGKEADEKTIAELRKHLEVMLV
jgi:DeoR family transcriptional regulator, fructose operon transcriptional repressor